MHNGITVIIPTMSRLETLRETLDSYVSGTLIPNQIVIVDQTQDIELRNRIIHMVDAYSNKTIVNYLFQEIPSSTKARNIGLRASENDLLIFSDDDITVQPETVENVVEIMRDHSISMIAGMNINDKVSKSKIGYLFAKKSYRHRNVGHVTKSMLGRFPEIKVEGLVDTQWAMGFFFAVRKNLVLKWDLRWDEKLTGYAYAEDLDFTYGYYRKSCAEQLRCVLSDNVVVDHRVSTEWRVPSRKSTMMYVMNREYLSYKHNMGWESRLLMKWCNMGDYLFRRLKNAKPEEFRVAVRICKRHKKEIKNGILKETWYTEQ